MNIEKVQWINGERKMNLAFPFAKVDKENRTVSGFATLNNVDRHGDIVLSDASKKAFERFRGNLREMHQPIAVGKVLSFNEEDFYDAESGKTYKGVFVQAYISKGAQDTWEKVLDGTLTGFSIGGNIVEASFELGDDESDEEKRVIKEYDLNELSLVDSPANPLANIFSIQKSGDNLIFKGMATEVETENVFWCKSDKVATSDSNSSRNCSICGNPMETVGWIEKYDSEKSESIKKVVDGYFKKDDAPSSVHGPNGTLDSPSSPLNVVDSSNTVNLLPDQAGNNISTTKAKKKKKKNNISKGGSIVSNDTLEEVENDQAEEINEVVEDGDDSAVEKAVVISEVELDDSDFTKMVTDLKDFVADKLEKSLGETSVQADEILKAFNEDKLELINKFEVAESELVKKFEDAEAENLELKKSIDELKSTVDELQKSLSETTTRVNLVESDTAIKKSGEVDNTEAFVKADGWSWRGSFLGANDL
jgi:hypothetical protein